MSAQQGSHSFPASNLLLPVADPGPPLNLGNTNLVPQNQRHHREKATIMGAISEGERSVSGIYILAAQGRLLQVGSVLVL